MNKKKYVKPQATVVRIVEPAALLSGSEIKEKSTYAIDFAKQSNWDLWSEDKGWDEDW